MKNAESWGMCPLLSILLALLPCSAQASNEEEFRALDLNGDNYVSLAEAAGFAEIVTRFDRADRNRDGKLSFAEFERLKKMKPKSAAAGGSASGSKPSRAGGPKRASPAASGAP